ncbi:NAD(P)/FAD-dependent oxidoreductase [Aurantimonas sp. HBX-1]|uniref:FAD-dependent oxidoreductase n=1 Tax=Aurantimonas sp. HBX-1 TaxID=2906072 RepID=UPI001F22BB6F|nr:NAD(P)/FAD-dependent oxidoreductase [Aurantimonas sp. HBX-1]UIJ73072.1 FAD-dependent monooxygenase [Aurantimonas sp. HBX-1]
MAHHRVILIAGAGPVGLAAAVELTRRGLPVRIIDAGEGPTPPEQSRALGTLPTTLAILAASGVSARLLAEGARITGADVARDGHRLFSIEVSAARTPTPFILSLPQGRTERIMVEWLAAHGVGVEWNLALEDIVDTHKPRAILANGETVAARAVVGCDGVHSRVREAVGIPWRGEGYPGVFSLADVRFSAPIDPTRAKVNIRSGIGGSALLPFGPHAGRYIGLGGDPEALYNGVSGIEAVTWTSRFSVAFRRAERMAKGRVFLAGDAAHVHSPVGGRGMNLGIWDAATLAFLLAEGRETEYETKRLPVVDEVLKVTRQMTDMVSRPGGPMLWLLPFAMPLVTRVPTVARRIAERALALDLPQPEWLAADYGMNRDAG